MSLSIHSNALSLAAQRNFKTHTTDQATLIARLTTGARIGGAADDPAGQAVVDRMSSGLRGNGIALRSINDGSSMLQVADSAMASIGESLQRLREMAVASGNGSYSADDRAALQKEAVQLLGHIDQVGKDTRFNGEAVFSQDTTSIGGDARKRVVLDGLKTGWLSAAEGMIEQYYGLEAQGGKLTVNLADSLDPADGSSNVLASVGPANGGLGLNIDMADFGTAPSLDGGGAPLYSDRIIAHEMAHAVMMNTMDVSSLPQWFVEGTAELIHGGDERLASRIAGDGGAGDVVSDTAGGTFSYEGGYAASRYLHARMKELGVEGGIKGVMQHMAQHRSDLDQALEAVSGGVFANEGAFLAEFGARGEAFINDRMNLSNADTGAIGGLDADGGQVRHARNVVPDAGDNNAGDGLSGFQVVYPELGGATGVRRVQVQASSEAGDLIELQFSSMNARALGLADLDMDKSAVAILHIDQALEFVNQQRAVVGASSNRLDIAASVLQNGSNNMETARDRIQDVDYATSTAGLTRIQILQQAASAMLAQANSQPRAVLNLLR
ncbi:flagellinolysin [Massilia niastensis]|uniref:flagellinolysin n=1 Tax=Massilia niastensis TaxID=544911 RepID=UPI000361938A|nr:flagellinolysin [Massilia niastensis]